MNNFSLKHFFIFMLITPALIFSQAAHVQYQPITLDFKLAPTNETAAINPFSDYRLQVEFSQGDKLYSVPGFYAADGNAANTSALSGGVWRVIFMPPFSGEWQYQVSFKKGHNIAIEDDLYGGNPIPEHDGASGVLQVADVPKNVNGFEKSGGLVYANSHYLHTMDGEPLLLFGTNSPENFLAYEDIDGTYSSDSSRQYLKTWTPHLQDWHDGDPTWQNGKGKGIIGALNYLASKKMNVLYAMTLNLEGDASDVWPFISHQRKDFKRYDVSKLAQWDIIFSHAEKLGIVLELVLQEQENQLLLDDGYLDIERKLYIRELIARFGYHKNIIWNIGEENGEHDHYWPRGQDDQQRYAKIRCIKDTDPYKRPVLMHTFSVQAEREPIAKRLLRYNKFDGLSLQAYNAADVHNDIIYWLNKSSEYAHPWLLMMDELGPWHTGAKSDAEDPDHDQIRKDVLWGALMAGATGVQWYFGWLTPPNDLNAEDWRSRNNLWEQSAVARDFFKKFDVTKMSSTDSLISAGDNYCFSLPGEVYVIYLKNGGTTKLDLREHTGEYAVNWYNPRQGGEARQGSISTVNGGQWVGIGRAPFNTNKDWTILVRKRQ